MFSSILPNFFFWLESIIVTFSNYGYKVTSVIFLFAFYMPYSFFFSFFVSHFLHHSLILCLVDFYTLKCLKSFSIIYIYIYYAGIFFILTMGIIFHIPNSLNLYYSNFNNIKSSSLQLIPVPLSYQCQKNISSYTVCPKP